MKRFILLLLPLLAACSSAPHVTPTPLKTVAHVDLSRYMGDWYVIASIPYSAEKGKVASVERYALRQDGKIAHTYTFRKEKFTAPERHWNAVGTVTNRDTNAEWRMQYHWPVKLDYYIIDLDSDYRWALVGHPSRNYLWVLARDRHLDETVYQGILQRAAAQGYDLSLVTLVPQPH